MTWLADTMEGDYLFGDTLSVADCYLFVMLLWANKKRYRGARQTPSLSVTE